MPLPKEDKIYTKKDLEYLPENERWEVINGKLYMQATPLIEHQEVTGNLYFQIKSYLQNKTCKVFQSPFELDLDDTQIYEPDVLIVCEKSKKTKRGYKGIPAFIAEVLSPSTARNDKITKFNIYKEKGVPEYWIIDPYYKTVDRFLLENKEYKMTSFTTDDETIELSGFSELKIDLKALFDYEKGWT